MDKNCIKRLLARPPSQHYSANAGAIAVTVSAISPLQHRAFSQVLHALLTTEDYTAVERAALEGPKAKAKNGRLLGEKGDTTAVDVDFDRSDLADINSEDETEDVEKEEHAEEPESDEEKDVPGQEATTEVEPAPPEQLLAVDAWTECLRAIPAGAIPLYPNIDSLLVLLAAHINQRHIRDKVSVDSPLAGFLRRPDVQSVMAARLCNAYPSATGPAAASVDAVGSAGATGSYAYTSTSASVSTSGLPLPLPPPVPVPSALEWGALVSLLRLRALPTPSERTSMYLAQAVTAGLTALLDASPRVWHGSNLNMQIRGVYVQ